MAVTTFGVIFHSDAIKPDMYLFVQYSHQIETKKHGLTIIISTTLWNIYQLLP